MEQALIGLAGVLLGLLISEHFRRLGRIEKYSAAVFQERLQKHADLFALVHNAQNVAYKILNDAELGVDERHSMWSNEVLTIASYCDENFIYLSEEVTVQCMTPLMGVDSIPDENDTLERARRTKAFQRAMLKTKRLLKSETGIARIETEFRKVSGSKPSGAAIDYYRALRSEK